MNLTAAKHAESSETLLTGPPGPVVEPGDCPGYGRQLPATWMCPPVPNGNGNRECPLARECYETLIINLGGISS